MDNVKISNDVGQIQLVMNNIAKFDIKNSEIVGFDNTLSSLIEPFYFYYTVKFLNSFTLSVNGLVFDSCRLLNTVLFRASSVQTKT